MSSRISRPTLFLLLLSILSLPGLSRAGVPLNNLQGVGGIAFNPLAYVAGQNAGDSKSPVSKPQFGLWYVSLDEVQVDWTALSASIGLFRRVELSWGYEVVAPAGHNIHKHSLGAKVLLVPENAGGSPAVPAVSAGVIWKRASGVAAPTENSSADLYLVASKLITQLPRPLLLSGGLLSTENRVTGVFGFDDKRDQTFFGNVDLLPRPNLALGFEYLQGAEFDAFRNSGYWDLHAAWFADPHLTLVAAYVNAGDKKSTRRVGLGDGLVLSAQYAF
ncbi:DUF3034 family protein [bacterium]|nr:DUF3034 family protein [bacterium]